VRREDWLGTAPRGDREVALAELARRYLRAFGPASDRDFACWSGLGLREVRSGLGAIAGELDETPLGEGTLLTLRGALPRLPRSGWIRLLGAFDTYLLGHRSRALSVPDEQMAAVKAAGGGWIRPVIVRDGIVIGGWHSALKGNRIEITLSAEGATASERSEIEAEVEDIGRFEGVEAVLR
jgi:hypothetical protein